MGEVEGFGVWGLGFGIWGPFIPSSLRLSTGVSLKMLEGTEVRSFFSAFTRRSRFEDEKSEQKRRERC